MESLKNTTDKNKINIPYDDIKKAAMTYGDLLSKHIEWDIDSGTLTYRNLISPTLGGRAFPEGYFDVKSLVFKKKDVQYAKELMIKCLYELPFEKDLDLLPPGASYEAYLRLEDHNGQVFYYTNTHVSKKNDFFVETEQIAECFMQLFGFLEKRCSFPYEGFRENHFKWGREGAERKNWIDVTDEETDGK